VKEGTRLQRLAAGMEAIPQKRRRQTLLGVLGQYGSRAAAAETTVKATAEAERCACLVFPGLPVAPAAEGRRKAARVAGRLAKRLREKIDAVQDPATDDDVALLVEHAKNAEKALRDRWARQLEDRLKGYGALVKAAEAAKLSGSRVMATQLTLLQRQSAAGPRTEAAAEEIRTAVAGLSGLVAQLGLEGASGRFLVSAAEGQGDARALCDPEVREFVERHGLWQLLVVGFR
jgi:hypothetical protein